MADPVPPLPTLDNVVARVNDHEARLAMLEGDNLVAKARTRWATVKRWAVAVMPSLGWVGFLLLAGYLALSTQGCFTPKPPPPTPPIPPNPPAPPVPPAPPAPIPVEGLRVLIIYETAELSKMPRPQHLILVSPEVRAFLNTTCAAGADGKTKEWRIWDRDTVTTGESTLWQNAMKRPRQSIPWIIVSNGKTGFEGPLPANSQELISLVMKFRG